MSEQSLWGDMPQPESTKPVKAPKLDLSKKANQPYTIGQKVWYFGDEGPTEVEILGYTKANIKIKVPVYSMLNPLVVSSTRERFVKLGLLSDEKP